MKRVEFVGEVITSDAKKLPLLLLGFVVMSVGIILIKRSDLGLFAWGVFHDGLSNVTGLSFGSITRYLGFIILVFSMIAFKTNLGPGTILNIYLVGLMIDWADKLISFIPDGMLEESILFVIGLVLMNIGKAFYISTRLGAGPRDGMFVGVSRITKVDVKYVKPGIEVLVLIIGYILGGVAGVGTFITMILSGYMIQYLFKIFHFDPKSQKQRNIIDYIRFIKEKDTI